jgi:mannitol 2-dehydrogenase
VRPADAAQRERLLARDGLTTLIELAPSGASAEISGAMIDFLPVDNCNAALVAKMADPTIRIVSLTVTEGGYYIRPDGGLDEDAADILHDAANPGTPRTAFGAMVEALTRRRAAGVGPFTGLSCDNLQANGSVLRRTVVSLARLSDPGLADWIDAQCSFPNSMVDCIAPATGQKELSLARAFGIEDAAPVIHEDFRQWVIEDDFCAGRPDWDRVGTVFSDRVHDYEMMKLRIRNAGHQLLANAGELLSIETISDCMQHKLIRAFFERVQRDEIAPQVAPVPDMTATAYIDLIERRFANPRVVDTTRRVAFDGCSRHPGFLLPMVRERLASDDPIEGLALAEALWARMCQGTREDGSDIAPNDPHWASLNAAAHAAMSDPLVWIAQAHLYGDLYESAVFANAFLRWLKRIQNEGTEAALRAFGT